MAKRNTGIEKIEGNTITVNDSAAFGDHLKNIAAALTDNVRIRKAKIKDDLFLEGEYSEELPGHSKKDSKFSCTVPVHDDLKTSFSNLHKHLAILCDEVTTPKKKDFDTTEFPGFTVRGFSIGGNDDNEGVTISGAKDGCYGTVNLNTPFTQWSNDEYPFSAQLSADVEACIYEVDQYLFHQKRAPEKQLAMEFEEGAEETGEETTEE